MKTIKTYSPSIVFLAFVAVLAVLFAALPKTDTSVNEKRELATLPTVSKESFFDGSLMTDFEEYLSDHFPGRDLFVGINSYYELVTGRGGTSSIYYGKDGYLIAEESAIASEDNVRRNMTYYNAFAEELELDATMMIVPSTGYILDDKLPAVHDPYHDADYLKAAANTVGNMHLIDLTTRFQAIKNDTQLYYKTDHHLTADGSYELYRTYLEQQGKTPLNDFRKESHDGFYGTCYSQSGYWLSEADTVELWSHPLTDDITVSFSNGYREPTVADTLFYREHLQNPDHYPVYLDGNHGLTKIVNPNADGGKLLILKDSFGNCVTTMLAAEYSEIYMIDLRYYQATSTNPIASIVTDNGIEEVLFVYGMDSVTTESSNAVNLFYSIETAIPNI